MPLHENYIDEMSIEKMTVVKMFVSLIPLDEMSQY